MSLRRGMIAQPSGGGGTDPYWANVVALIHFDGLDGSVVFDDSKTPGSGWAASGNAQIDTAQSKFGGASGLFDANGDYLTKAHSTDFSVSGVDCTIEAWLRRDASTGVRTIITKRPSNASASTEYIFFIDNGVLRFIAWDAAFAAVVNLTGSSTLSSSAFTHVAACKASGTWRLFAGGFQEASGTETGTVGTNTSSVYIGRDPTVTTRDWGGWMDDLRITKGVARYTANFTPPTAAFPNS